MLFFLELPALNVCFHKLAKSLAPQGTLAFTMVDDCEKTSLEKFHGMSQKSIIEMLDKEGLELVKITCSEPPYGTKRISIPTFDIYARKK